VALVGALLCGAARAAPTGGGAPGAAPTPTPSPQAQPSPEQQARALFKVAQEHYQAERYTDALVAFNEAYRLSRRAELLYNIGLVNERLGLRDAAITAYELYVLELPGATDRATVQARIKFLKLATPAPATPVAAAPPAAPAATAVAPPAASRASPSGAPAPLRPPDAATTAPRPAPPSVGGSPSRAPTSPSSPSATEASPELLSSLPTLRSPRFVPQAGAVEQKAPEEPKKPAATSSTSASSATASSAVDLAQQVAQLSQRLDAQERQPVYKRPWFIATLAATGGLVVGAVTVGAVLGSMKRFDTLQPVSLE
jgi:tetratricopeptide (TPR) repeat protein